MDGEKAKPCAHTQTHIHMHTCTAPPHEAGSQLTETEEKARSGLVSGDGNSPDTRRGSVSLDARSSWFSSPGQ